MRVEGLLLLGIPAAAILFLGFTPQGRDILAQLTGMVSFETYDPKKTDLFPFATGLEEARKTAKDELARLSDVLKPK